MPDPLYLFLDEGGDLNFSPTGSRYFTLTSMACFRPFPVDGELSALRFNVIEEGHDLERFHACEDRQAVRDRVFGLISPVLRDMRVDSVIVEKCKTGPALQVDERFYPQMLGYLLRWVIQKNDMNRVSEVIAITDSIPINRKRKAVEKAIKMTLAQMLPNGTHYRILHHPSHSCPQLQVVDYINWAIFRKWERSDDRSLSLIRPAIKSQFEIFRNGVRKYY